MSDSPKVSLIVPVYRVQAYLDRCVQSITSQTYANLDIILVDDGSPDECPKMCDEWAKRDQRIRVIHKENGGLSDARNAGLAVASGEYIGFIDSDDWIEPMFVENLLNAILEYDCDVAGCKYRRCSDETKYDNKNLLQSVEILGRVDAMRELINGNAVKVVVWNKLYKKALIDGILFEKGKYHEDEFWTYQVIGRLKRHAVTDYVGYNYFQRADSIMGEGYSLKRLDALEARACRLEYLEANMPGLADNERVMLHFCAMNHVQAAIKHLRMDERKTAIEVARKVIQVYPISLSLRKKQKMTWRIWLVAERISFVLVCGVRNLLKIGL